MIRIVQQLCPKRHCIMALAYDPAKDTGDKAVDLLRTAIAVLKLNPRCGICGSKQLVFEDRATKFATIEEATPALRQTETDCLMTRKLLDACGVSQEILAPGVIDEIQKVTRPGK